MNAKRVPGPPHQLSACLQVIVCESGAPAGARYEPHLVRGGARQRRCRARVNRLH